VQSRSAGLDSPLFYCKPSDMARGCLVFSPYFYAFSRGDPQRSPAAAS
jgi:hypothetical protein